MEIVSLGICGAALVLSVILAIVEARRYCIPIRLRIIDTQLYESGENWVIILVQVSLVNRASAGRTMFEMQVKPLNTYQVSQLHGQYDFLKGLVICTPPSSPKSIFPVCLPIDDILPQPLDISPHQAMTGWIALGVSPKPPLKQDFEAVAHLIARDVDGHELAKREVILQQLL